MIVATPGLMTPPNITVAASDAAAVTKKSVTVSQLNLLGLSDIDINYLSDIFFRVDGYGSHVGSSYDPYYGGSYELYVQDGVDADGKPHWVRALNADGQALTTSLDADGVPNVGIPVYVEGEDGKLKLVNGEGDEPTYGTGYIPGNITRDGLVGVAYYLGDQILDEIASAGVPLISDAANFAYLNVTSYFFEGGIEETFRVVASELTGGINGPVGQALATAEDLSHNWLTYTGAILTLAASGVPLVGPDLAAATSIFFFGGPVETDGKEYNQGIDGVINYVVDRVIGTVTAPPSETDPDDTESADAKGATTVLASADKALPALSKLINLKLDVEDAKQAVEGVAVVDNAESVTEDSAGTTAPATEVSQLAATKAELSKLSNLKLKLNPVDAVEEASAVEEVKDTVPEENSGETAPKPGQVEEKSSETAPKPVQAEEKAGTADSADTGATGKTANKFAPKSRTTERKKSAGEKFVENATKNLEKAFKPTTKAGADKQETAKGATAKGASDSDSGAKAGNTHADAKSAKDSKDSKDSKGHKDK